MTAELNRYGGSSTVTVVFLVGSKSLGVFFFFLTEIWLKEFLEMFVALLKKKL